MLTKMIDDDTWARLDPNAGAFTPKQRRRAVLAFGAAALVAALVWIVWWSGVFAPRLALQPDGEGFPGRVIGRTQTFHYEVMLANLSPRAETIVSAGRSGPGLKLLSEVGATGAFSPLPGSTSTTLQLTYEVTDCSAVVTTDWPIPVTVQRGGSRHVLMLHAPTVDTFFMDGDPASGGMSFDQTSTGDGAGDDVPWQVALAQQICRSPDRAANQ